MRTVFLLLMMFILSSCESSQPIQDEQKRLIDQEITASNTFKIVKKGEVIYEHTQNSGKLGDKDITTETIFPIWSMSKPITTVAMMILYDQKGFELSDNCLLYTSDAADE